MFSSHSQSIEVELVVGTGSESCRRDVNFERPHLTPTRKNNLLFSKTQPALVVDFTENFNEYSRALKILDSVGQWRRKE